MPPVIATADADRSPDDVIAYATDPTRFSEWQNGVVEGQMEQAGVPSVGARCLTTRRIVFANRPSDGPIRAIVNLTVEPIGPQRSRLTITVDFEGHGIGKLLVPLVASEPTHRPTRTPQPHDPRRS